MKKYLLFGLLAIMVIILTSCLNRNYSGGYSSPSGANVAAPIQHAPVQQFCDRQVPRTTTERVCIQVPYECQKSCKVEKVVIENVPLLYTDINHWMGDQGGFWTTKTYNAHVAIRNDDNIAGIFKVKFNLRRTDGSIINEEDQLPITPYQTKTIISSWHSSISNFTYEVITPTKEKLVNKLVDSTCPNICYKQECRNEQKVTYTAEKVPC